MSPGLKKHYPDVRFSGNKVTPDEVDEYVYTNIYYPTASASWFGTAAAGSATQTKEFVMLQQQADYTRTPLLTITCASGTITSGTCYLTGTDQFGYAQTEEISALGTSGVTRAGTKIFKTISAGSLVLANEHDQGFMVNQAIVEFWKSCNGKRKITELVEIFAQQTGLQRNQVEKEVMQLIKQLSDGGLILIPNQPETPNVEFKKR